MQNKFAAYFIKNVEEQYRVFFYCTARNAKEAMDVIKLDEYISVMSEYSPQLICVPFHNIAYVVFIEEDRR